MDFRRVLPEATIYVYDNNSTDGTAELARTAGAVVRHEYQQGKGNVIRRMFREIDAEAYIMVDGDDTYPAEAAPEMVKAVTEHQADMVVGIGFPPPITPRTNARSTILATTWCGFYQQPLRRPNQGYHDGLPCVQLPVCQNLPGAEPRL